jgi:TolB-like protein/Flp pilus assembly protein TadD
MPESGGSAESQASSTPASEGMQDRPSASDVFISYASQDVAVATAVVEALERNGIACWIAPRDVTPGTFYGDEIVHAIDATRASVLILSQNAAASQHVLREVERAASKRHAVVSLRIDQAPLPAGFEYFLNTSQWLDASGGDAARMMPKLVAAVRQVIKKPSIPDAGIAGTPPRTSALVGSDRALRRTAIVVGSIVAVAIAGFAAYRLWLPGHRVVAPATAVGPGTTAAVTGVPAIPEKSVAVLPFVDMSEKKDQEYFSDGMSEELIDMLTKIPDLRVPARTSSFYYKGKQATIAEIAKALGVAHVLEGSVRKSGKTLRVTAQLIRVDNGYHMWSQTYDRTLDDVFKMQDEIAGAVVEALKVSLLAGTNPESTATQSTESYALYLQARYLLPLAETKGDYESVFSHVTRALSLDPKFAAAWALRARARASYYSAFLGGSVQQVRRDAEDDAKQALALDSTLPDPHLAMASIYWIIDWNWDAADREYNRALQLDANNTSALRGLSFIALIHDRLDQALQFAQRAIERDPLNSASYETLARVQSRRGQHALAEIADRKALELQSTARTYHFWVGYDLLMQGEPAAALTEFERELDEEIRGDGLMLALPALGRTQEAERIAAEMEKDHSTTSAANLAAYYACRKDFDRAFAWLDRAYSRRDIYVLATKEDICFKNLVHDPRYKAFLSKLNLSE